MDFQYKIIDSRYIFLSFLQKPVKVAQCCDYTKNCFIVHFKMVSFMYVNSVSITETLMGCKALFIVGF